MSQDHDNRHHFIDFENFVIPSECMHNSNFHDCGIARGLEVSSTEDKTKIIINPGVAIENISGQLISLSNNGQGAIDDPDPEAGSTKTVTVPVPVFLSTEKSAGQIAYVTIESLDSSSSSLGNITIVEQTPWVRLQQVADYEKSPIAVTRSEAKFSSASSNQVSVTSAEDAAKFKPDDYVLLVKELKSERAKISKISGSNITFEKDLHNTYKDKEGTIRIAELIPQQKVIRLDDIAHIKSGTCIVITQKDMAEVRIVDSVNASNKSITLTEGLVNAYKLEGTDYVLDIQIVNKSIVLAIAVIDNDGKIKQLVGNPSELKGVANLPKYHRHLIGAGIGELRIQRSIIGDYVHEIFSGKICPGDGGGLKITVPSAEDSILFTREGGEYFNSLEINADVHIGTQGNLANLIVNGDVNGKANLAIDGKVGIGTTDPLAPLHLSGGNSDLIGIECDLKIGDEKHSLKIDVATSGANAGDVRLRAVGETNRLMLGGEKDETLSIVNGNVGIGKTNPSEKLEVSGIVKAEKFIGDGSAITGILSAESLTFNMDQDTVTEFTISSGSYVGYKSLSSDIHIVPKIILFNVIHTTGLNNVPKVVSFSGYSIRQSGDDFLTKGHSLLLVPNTEPQKTTYINLFCFFVSDGDHIENYKGELSYSSSKGTITVKFERSKLEDASMGKFNIDLDMLCIG